MNDSPSCFCGSCTFILAFKQVCERLKTSRQTCRKLSGGRDDSALQWPNPETAAFAGPEKVGDRPPPAGSDLEGSLTSGFRRGDVAPVWKRYWFSGIQAASLRLFQDVQHSRRYEP